MWSQKERESLGGKSPSFSVRIYRENEGSRSRRGGREGVVRVSVAIYPVEGDMCVSLPPVLLPRPLALSQPPSLAPRNYVRNERKAPPGRGREPFPWKATRFIIRGLDVTPDRSQTTFYPEPAAKDRPPRFTREEDPEKSRVYNSRLNFCPCFWRGSIFRLRWIVGSLMIPRRLIACRT